MVWGSFDAPAHTRGDTSPKAGFLRLEAAHAAARHFANEAAHAATAFSLTYVD
jgi:hypothetical protein